MKKVWLTVGGCVAGTAFLCLVALWTGDLYARYQLSRKGLDAYLPIAQMSSEKACAAIVAIIAAGKQSDAEAVLDVLLRVRVSDAGLHFLRGACHRSRFGEYSAARHFRKAIAFGKNTPEARCAELVLDLDAKKNVDRNFASFARLVDAHPDKPMFRWMLAVQCRALKRNEEGIAHYRRLLEQWSPGPALVHQTYANLLDDAHQHEESLKHRELAVKLEEAAYSVQGLAATLVDLGRYDEAITNVLKALVIDPEYAKSWDTWAFALQRKGLLREAFAKRLKAAELGEVSAMATVGYDFACGLGVEKDYAKAVEWTRKAEAVGDKCALNNLGWFYTDGLGVERDYETAMSYYQRAAEAGDHWALSNIGDMYAKGLGVKKDGARAMEYQQSALSFGEKRAMVTIGCYYENGTGVKKDPRKALEWYEKAAAEGDEDGIYNAALLYHHGRGIPVNHQRAFELFMSLARAHFRKPSIYAYLGVCYADGLGVARDCAEAEKWFRAAIANGYDEGVDQLARRFSKGPMRDLSKALVLHREMADKGRVQSMNAAAWALATSPEPSLLDGKAAIVYAQKAAAAAPGEQNYVDTLAAAYARDGQFDKAVEAQQRAIAMLESAPAKDKRAQDEKVKDLANYRSKLEQFSRREPYTEPPE